MKTFLAVFFGILAAALVILAAAGLFMGVRSAREEVARERASLVESALSRVRIINTACVTYETTYNRGFPEALADMAPPQGWERSKGADLSPPDRKHAALIDEVLASGSAGGYTFTYRPTRGTRSGGVQGYQIWASPQRQSSPPLRSFYSDETGVVRYTNEARPASESDPPIAG